MRRYHIGLYQLVRHSITIVFRMHGPLFIHASQSSRLARRYVVNVNNDLVEMFLRAIDFHFHERED